MHICCIVPIAASMIPGLWMAPFACDTHSQLSKDHPDWILKRKSHFLVSGIVLYCCCCLVLFWYVYMCICINRYTLYRYAHIFVLPLTHPHNLSFFVKYFYRLQKIYTFITSTHLLIPLPLPSSSIFLLLTLLTVLTLPPPFFSLHHPPSLPPSISLRPPPSLSHSLPPYATFRISIMVEVTVYRLTLQTVASGSGGWYVFVCVF